MSKTPQWALDRIAEAKRTGATTLDLSRWVYDRRGRLMDVDLSLSALSEVPADVRGLSGLTVLNVASNNLTELPEWLGEISGLTVLNVASNGLMELPESLGGLSGLTALTVASNFLMDLPEWLGGLSALTALNAARNRLTELPEWLGGLNGLTSLNVARNRLTELSESLGRLSGLTVLNVASNNLTELPEWLGEMRGLTALNVANNGLGRLPKWLGKLSRLTLLDVSSNELGSLPEQWLGRLPEWLGGLSGLTALNVANNRLGRLPEWLGGLSRLTSLNVSRNGLGSLPEWLGELRVLTSLNVTNNGLKDFPESLGGLIGLTALNVANNRLESLPKWLGGLSGLTALNVANNRLESLPKWLGRLSELSALNVANNGLRSLPEWLGELRKLTSLNVANNRLGGLPEWLGGLSELTALNVANSGLTELPEWLGGLTALTVLDVANNRLESLPEVIMFLPRLRALIAHDNPWNSPPPEVFGNATPGQPSDLEGLREYSRQRREQGTAKLYEAKLLIVGEGGAGKTSLARKLNDPHAALPGEKDTTHGIHQLTHEFPMPGGGAFRLNVWDFGGQEIYHATHQYFLTKRSVYALVADDRKEDTDFNYWLNTVELLAGDSPLAVVKNEKGGRTRSVNESAIRARFENVKHFLPVDLATPDERLAETRRFIETLALSLPLVGVELPARWVDVRVALEDNPVDTIRVDEYIDLCKESGIERESDALQLSGYLHDLGVILHFQGDPVLYQTVILKPEWGTTAAYTVLDDIEIKRRGGRFNRADLARIWAAPRWAGKRSELLKLMLNFKLCYALPGGDEFIAPALLPIETPPYPWDESDNLILRYRYDFMPKGILSRLIVEVNDLIQSPDQAWKSGVLLTYAGARAEVIETWGRNEIRIRAAGKERNALLMLLQRELGKIHDTYQGLKASLMVPCNCAQCASSQSPFAYEMTRLEDFLARGLDIQCQQSGEMVAVRPLVDAVRPRYDQMGEDVQSEFVLAGVRGLSERLALKAHKYPPNAIFISYAWRGESEEVTDKIDAALQAAGFPVVRDKRDLGFKGRIRGFMEQIGRGQAVVLVISDRYLKSENCMYELVQVANAGEFADRIFPVVLGDAKIYKPVDRLEYVKFWEEQIAEFDAKLKTVSSANLHGFREEIDLYTEIRRMLPELANILKDMNTLTVDIHEERGYEDLVKAIRARVEK